MRWYIRKNIFAINSMTVMEYDLSKHRDERPSYPMFVGGLAVSAARLFEINSEYGAKMEKAISQMDYKSPFNIQEAKRRIKEGGYFIILENGSEIIGWSWAAVNRVFFDEFNCFIEIKERCAFSYNLYIKKQYRGKRLNHVTLGELLYQLKNDGYNKAWVLVQKWNNGSLKSLNSMGWRIVGDYKFIKLMFLNFRFPPQGI
jgi:GNAT superfamily N-acetyltransferase